MLNEHNFQSYGHVLNTDNNFNIINEGKSFKWNHLVPFNTFLSKEGHNIGILRTELFDATISKLERHRFTSQLFYPISGKRSLVVVAKGSEKEIDMSKIEVFMMNGNQGVCFHPLTWHYQLIPIDGPTEYLTIMLKSDKPDIEYSNEFPPFTIEKKTILGKEV
ncbi:ureidoglycolate lyase [Bacillus aerolatus]|uniref:ureidoglycolate lyase n=1 Tax=Bacillus aerolatus TaxID=2653354 RepID=UPI001780C340|nr:ureidoglycolate lyase [Bacillus aerolatus]